MTWLEWEQASHWRRASDTWGGSMRWVGLQRVDLWTRLTEVLLIPSRRRGHMLLDQVPHMLLPENEMALSSSGLSCVAGVLLTRQLVQERFCRRSLYAAPCFPGLKKRRSSRESPHWNIRLVLFLLQFQSSDGFHCVLLMAFISQLCLWACYYQLFSEHQVPCYACILLKIVRILKKTSSLERRTLLVLCRQRTPIGFGRVLRSNPVSLDSHKDKLLAFSLLHQLLPARTTI